MKKQCNWTNFNEGKTLKWIVFSKEGTWKCVTKTCPKGSTKQFHSCQVFKRPQSDSRLQTGLSKMQESTLSSIVICAFSSGAAWFWHQHSSQQDAETSRQVHVPAAKEKIRFTFSTYLFFLLSSDFRSTTLALAVVWLRGWTSGGFGTATRWSLLRFSLFWWHRATSILFLPVTWQEITDGGFNAWTETVVHLWVHNLCDDSVHTRLQHTRSERKTKGGGEVEGGLSQVCFQTCSNASLVDVH